MPPRRGAKGKGGRGGSRREGRGRFVSRRRSCSLCGDKASSIDYKEPGKLRRFISERGKIDPRRRTGICARHQRVVAVAIKRARHLALLPFIPEHMRRVAAVSQRESGGGAAPA